MPDNYEDDFNTKPALDMWRARRATSLKIWLEMHEGEEMRSNEYQELAWSTLKPFFKATTDSGTFINLQLATAILGLTAKTGKLAESVQHMIDTGEYLDHNFRDKFIEDLGDIQWYVATVGKMLGLTLEEVMQRNISMLRGRYPKGVLQDKETKF
jgi:hypothetical protein